MLNRKLINVTQKAIKAFMGFNVRPWSCRFLLASGCEAEKPIERVFQTSGDWFSETRDWHADGLMAAHRLWLLLFPLSDTLLTPIEESSFRQTPKPHTFDQSDQFVSLANPCVCSLPLGSLCWRIRFNHHHISSTAKALGAEVTYRKPRISALMTGSIIEAGWGMLFVPTLSQ